MQAGFTYVSRLTITPDKGWFVMDDLAMSAISPVPETGSVVMLMAGSMMTGFAVYGRKYRKS